MQRSYNEGPNVLGPGPRCKKGAASFGIDKGGYMNFTRAIFWGARAHWYGHGTSRKYTLEGRLVRVETQHWESQRRVAKMATAGNVNRK